jgi:DNA-binding protein Fis
VRKVLLLSQGYTIAPEHIRAAIHPVGLPTAPADRTLRQFVDELLSAAQRSELTDAHARLLLAAEKEIFGRAIELAHGNQAKAARWVGVSRLTMREKLLQFGLHPAREPGKGAVAS